ncbi:MAG: hypothetical protein HYV63_02280 [Candidatus Schekmanbacteria bacterium]|nr:hypothetical protein [Candidatus Schekmanbacteria bacterium]
MKSTSSAPAHKDMSASVGQVGAAAAPTPGAAAPRSKPLSFADSYAEIGRDTLTGESLEGALCAYRGNPSALPRQPETWHGTPEPAGQRPGFAALGLDDALRVAVEQVERAAGPAARVTAVDELCALVSRMSEEIVKTLDTADAAGEAATERLGLCESAIFAMVRFGLARHVDALRDVMPKVAMVRRAAAVAMIASAADYAAGVPARFFARELAETTWPNAYGAIDQAFDDERFSAYLGILKQDADRSLARAARQLLESVLPPRGSLGGPDGERFWSAYDAAR